MTDFTALAAAARTLVALADAPAPSGKALTEAAVAFCQGYDLGEGPYSLAEVIAAARAFLIV